MSTMNLSNNDINQKSQHFNLINDLTNKKGSQTQRHNQFNQHKNEQCHEQDISRNNNNSSNQDIDKLDINSIKKQ